MGQCDSLDYCEGIPMVEIKNLTTNDIPSDVLLNFRHREIITKKWINQNGQWNLVAASDLREWKQQKRIWISGYLCQQLERGGSVVAAYTGDTLVGFCCADGCLAGKTAKYANMTMLFVDDQWKRKGIGRKLFENICFCAKQMGAEKLFISAVPSFDTIAFYFAMGCVDAGEVIPEYVDTNEDRYLEFSLTDGKASSDGKS